MNTQRSLQPIGGRSKDQEKRVRTRKGFAYSKKLIVISTGFSLKARPMEKAGQAEQAGQIQNLSILRGKTFYIKPYGCQMNFYDADKIKILLQNEGMHAIDGPSQADVIILVTCHIREKAKHKVYTELGFLKNDKKRRLNQGKHCIIAVGGCVAQAVGEKMFCDVPFLDVVFGTQTYHRLPGLIAQSLVLQEDKIKKALNLSGAVPANVTRKERFSDLALEGEHKIDHLPLNHTKDDSDLLVIQEGCNKFCTYCVVPYTRGREIFRSAQDILTEAQNMVDAGIHSLTLFGQNVNAYYAQAPEGYPTDEVMTSFQRDDSYDALEKDRLIHFPATGPETQRDPWHRPGQEQDTLTQTREPAEQQNIQKSMWNFAQLIYAISKIKGVERIFYTSSHPLNMDHSIIEAHAKIPALLPYVHLPVQSGSDRILKMMNRRHTAQEYLDIIQRFRRATSHIAFASDFIVGFPGETQEDFEDTLRLVEKVQYAQSYSFKYSRRPGTPAYSMPNQVDEKEKERRLMILQDLLGQQQKHFNQNCVGRKMSVFFHKLGKQPGQVIGKSPYMQSVVIMTSDPQAMIRQKREVLIQEATLSSLRGEVLD